MLRRNRICCWFSFGVFATKTSRDSGFRAFRHKRPGENGDPLPHQRRDPGQVPGRFSCRREIPIGRSTTVRGRLAFGTVYGLRSSARTPYRDAPSRFSIETLATFGRGSPALSSQRSSARPWRRGTERSRPRAPDRATRGRGPSSHGRTPRALPARLRDSHPRRSAPPTWRRPLASSKPHANRIGPSRSPVPPPERRKTR